MAIAALLALAEPALAESLEDQAVRCWNIPSAASDIGFAAIFDVDLDDDGDVTDITVTDWTPRTDLGERTVRSAARAIQQCSPYQVSAAGRFTFRMDPASLFDQPIDPFKPKSSSP